MPKLFLHVGLPKTATTTVQSFLSQNDAALQRKGWLYPKTARQEHAHHIIGGFFRGDSLGWIKKENPEDVKKQLRAEVRASGCKNVVMSTETLASIQHGTGKVESIRDFFSDFDVFPVFFLRRQDLWIEAAARSTMMIRVNSLDKEAFLKSRRDWLDHSTRLSHWADVFGKENMRVETFSKGNGRLSVERMFADTVGMPFDDGFSLSPPSNTTLNRDCLEYVMRTFGPQRLSPKFWNFTNILSHYSAKHPDPAKWKYIWTPSERLELIKSCAETNEKVAQDYFGKTAVDIYQDRIPTIDDKWEQYPGLTTDKALKIGSFLSQRLFERLKKR